MVDNADRVQHEEPEGAHRFRTLPPRIQLDDTVTTQAAGPPPEPAMGRDPNRDFLLRNAG